MERGLPLDDLSSDKNDYYRSDGRLHHLLLQREGRTNVSTGPYVGMREHNVPVARSSGHVDLQQFAPLRNHPQSRRKKHNLGAVVTGKERPQTGKRTTNKSNNNKGDASNGKRGRSGIKPIGVMKSNKRGKGPSKKGKSGTAGRKGVAPRQVRKKR